MPNATKPRLEPALVACSFLSGGRKDLAGGWFDDFDDEEPRDGPSFPSAAIRVAFGVSVAVRVSGFALSISMSCGVGSEDSASLIVVVVLLSIESKILNFMETKWRNSYLQLVR